MAAPQGRYRIHEKCKSLAENIRKILRRFDENPFAGSAGQVKAYFRSDTNRTTIRSIVSKAFLVGRLLLLVMTAKTMSSPVCVVA